MRKIIFKCGFIWVLLVLTPVLLNAELIAYYEFESDARDRSGFAINADGEFIDTAGISTDAAIGSGALKLGGYTDYVDLGNDSKFDMIDEITVSAWVKVQFFAEYLEAFVTKGDTSWRLQRYSQGPNVEFSCNGLFIGPDEKGVYQLYSKTEIDDGKWHHIVGLYDGEKIRIYIDGKLDAEKPAQGKMDLNDCPVYIGENAENMGRGFCGWIDSVSIYNHALTEDEIQLLYNKKISPQRQQLYDVIKEFTSLINADNGQQAEEYLEQKIGSLNKFAQQNQHEDTFNFKLYSELLVLLAKAEENIGSDKYQVAHAYSNALNYDLRLTDLVDCYMWLLKNLTAEELNKHIEQIGIFENTDQNHVVLIAEYFLNNDNYNDFQLFFETFFNDKYRPAQFGLAVRDALSANQQWLERFDGMFKINPQWLELTKFEKCQNEFDAGRYQLSIILLEAFLKDYKGSAWAFDKNALLLAGQCYVQVGKTKKAYDSFLQLIFEY
ncbi:MAG: hypothetical protein KAS96_06640, partial [Planctomycetes bacterium]|nr:hypothetical protein [Planctomycetota bacterium]